MQVFFDDFSVYGHKEKHFNHFKKCMTQCRNNGINFNLEKCAFCVNSGVLLGHIVYEDRILVDLRKINISTNMLTSTSATNLKRFLGATCLYRHYFRNFAIKTAPMCKLLKDTHYWWDEACE
jgi:hypothetical protein